MRSRKSANEQVAEVARRRLELLSAELAEIRSDPVVPPSPDPGGSGEPSHDPFPPSAVAGALDDDRPGRHAHRSVGVAAALGGWTHDRLPPTLQGRVRLTASHLAVLALLVTAALAVTAWSLVGARGSETTLPAVASPATALAPVASQSQDTGSTTSPTATTSGAPPGGPPGGAPGGPPGGPSGSIVVDVAGKVRRPGIATLPPGSRVVDALHAAGGARPGVHLGSLNLARVLVDGEQVVVGVPAPPGVAASAASEATGGSTATPMVNINTGTQADLEELPGVGPVTAQAILAFRTENGAFTTVDELLEVSGIGDATLAKIAPFVTL